MADKNAHDAHALSLQRNIEKQGKTLEKVAESEKLANARVVRSPPSADDIIVLIHIQADLERGMTKLESLNKDLKVKLQMAEQDFVQYRAMCSDARKRVEQVCISVSKMNTLTESLSCSSRRL